MSEWWTYRPSDFLMFAPRTWWRLFELQNDALWPAQVPFTLLSLALAVGLWRRHDRALRWGAACLAFAWALVAYSFLWQRYAPINWAACGFAWAFACQAVGLLALSSRHAVHAAPRPWRHRSGLGLVLWAVLAHPLLAPAFGRPWAQAEVIGLAPDPTTIATLGLLLCAQALTPGARLLLEVLRAGAMAWLVVSAATLATMGSAQAAVPLAAVLIGAAAWMRRAQCPPR